MSRPDDVLSSADSRDPLRRFNGRVLDPSTAARLRGAPAPSPTVYRSNVLLVTADTRESTATLLTAIDEEAKTLRVQRAQPDAFDADTEDPEHNRRAQLLRLAQERGIPLVFPVVVESATDDPVAVDVWPLLLRLRRRGFRSRDPSVPPAG